MWIRGITLSAWLDSNKPLAYYCAVAWKRPAVPVVRASGVLPTSGPRLLQPLLDHVDFSILSQPLKQAFEFA